MRLRRTREQKAASSPEQHPDVAGLLRWHLERAKRDPSSANSNVRKLLDRLLADDLFPAIVSAIEEGLPGALAGPLVNCAPKIQPGLYVAVTVSPWLDPADFRAHVKPDGYLSLLGLVMRPVMAQTPPTSDFVHLIYCTADAAGRGASIHTMLMIRGDPPVMSFPLDLLTGEERLKLGRR
jgi:hypothetical protein